MARRGVACYAIVVVTFTALACLAHRYAYLPGDVGIARWVQQSIPPGFQATMVVVSGAGYAGWAALTVGVIAGGLWGMHRRREAIFTVLLAASSALADWPLKAVVGRPGVESVMAGIMAPGASSFPSGHVTYVVVFYGFLLYLAPRLIGSQVACVAVRVVLGLLVLLMTVSRVYLGAHWPSDTLGGLLLGALLLSPAIAWYNRSRRT